MRDRVIQEQLKADLMPLWAIIGIMSVILAGSIIICHILNIKMQQPIPDAQRIMIRTVLYGIAIASFPITNLIRHIQLRLNQTMPISDAEFKQADESTKIAKAKVTAKRRYFKTILVSTVLMGTLDIYGVAMFFLGDNFNTLYIFTGMSALGLYLYRPKPEEYCDLVEALSCADA